MENYDPATGRYSYGTGILPISESTLYCSNKTSKWMPNYKHSITPDDKFVNYSLNYNSECGKNKAYVYEHVLGYTIANYSSLKEQIHNAITSGYAKLIKKTYSTYGVKYVFEINVKGVNNHYATVIAVYQIDISSKNPRMISNFIK